MRPTDNYTYKLARPFCMLYILAVLLCLSIGAAAQEKYDVQIKPFDQQLRPYKNIEVSINGKKFVAIGPKGIGFTELSGSDLPIRSISINDDQLEAASWNYSKGIVEVIVRRKNYLIAHMVLKSPGNHPLQNLNVTFKGKKVTIVTVGSDGKFDIQLALDEKITTTNQFSIPQYDIINLTSLNNEYVLVAEPVKPKEQPQQPVAGKATSKEYFRNFDISMLDSIQSLTVFYVVFKNYNIKNLSAAARLRVDAKFKELVDKLENPGRITTDISAIGRITDSSFVYDDIKNLLNQARQEGRLLIEQRGVFGRKIQLINDKLAAGVENFDSETRSQLLSDLTLLERLLVENERRFFKNQTDYRQLINAIKEKYFNFQKLENKLSESEAQRLEEQQIFRQRLLIISGVVVVFGILIVLLIYFSNALRRQKKELFTANVEIKRINENLEGLVFQRTRLLSEAHKELDTFLYRASHDMRSPVCSIIGLCNIAMHFLQGEAIELINRIVTASQGMDRLLKKLTIISEINHPNDFSSISLPEAIEVTRQAYSKVMEENNVHFFVECPSDIVMRSYPYLVQTILDNLVENAIYYSMLKSREQPKVEFRAVVRNNAVEISVYDNGIGVDPSINKRLFEMFFRGTEQSKGNGLGLYIVRKAIDALGGNIHIESEPGKFTRFLVVLPLETIPVRKNYEVDYSGQELNKIPAPV